MIPNTCWTERPGWIYWINILGFSWLKDNNKYHHTFRLREDETGELLNEDLEIEFLQTPGAQFFISVINAGEVYYIVYRERGKEVAQLVENELYQLNSIRIIDATWERVRIAAELKARGGISYADCFAAALAIEKDAPLITGDKEFSIVSDKVQVIWLK